jgi:hypothetical protein
VPTTWDTVFATTATKSTVITSGSIVVDFACSGTSGPSCFSTGGLYLDGAPVPGTFGGGPSPAAGGSSSNFKFVFSGRVADIPPGTHHLRLGFHQTSGSPNVLTATNVDGSSGYVQVARQP